MKNLKRLLTMVLAFDEYKVGLLNAACMVKAPMTSFYIRL